MNWLKRKLKYNFSNFKWFRKWCGGYWEKWYIDIIHGDVWFNIKKETAYKGIINDNYKYRPGCGFGTPYCEYYPIEYFGSKLNLNKDKIILLERKTKLNRILL